MRAAQVLHLLLLLFSASSFVPGVSAQALSKRIDNVPMYGQPELQRPEEFKLQDEKFIAEAVAGMKTREEASNAWWAQAEEFLSRRNYDLAMRRYNQAWLLNPNSFKPYWGFARVLLEHNDLRGAMAQFDRAVALVDDKVQEPALLTDAASIQIAIAETQKNADDRTGSFSKADRMYKRAIELDPEYGNAYKRYAMSLYSQRDFVNAWKITKEALKRSNTKVPPGFLNALRQEMAEPVN